MNIYSIENRPFSQNSAGSGRREIHASLNPEASISRQEQPIPESAIGMGISYLKEQLDEQLTSYPPFFPAGTYQRPDLIKKIQTLEEQIGKSAVDESVKGMSSSNKIKDDATDSEISAALNRLLVVKDKITEKKTIGNEPIHNGTFLNIQV
jgi:hypothetical protein